MNIKRYFSILLFFVGLCVFGQVGINTENPNAKTLLHVSEQNGTQPKTYKGIIIPRYTTTERDAQFSLSTLDNGLLIFNTTQGCFNYWRQATPAYTGKNAAWITFCEDNTTPVVTPSITTLNCASATFAPATLTQGVSYSGTLSVPYTGGNGQTYPAGTSFIVNGLTFTLQAGTLTNSTGNLVYSVSGTPTTNGNMTVNVAFDGKNCAVTKNVASGVTVTAPAITTQPQSSTTVCINNGTTLSVTASGTAPLSYQWYSNSSASNSGGTLISGATNSSYPVPASATAGNRYYYAVATNSAGSATSNVATVTSSAGVTITGITPINQTVNRPANETTTATNLAVTAAGEGTISYQWYRNTTNSTSSGTLINGATAASYTPSTVTEGTTYYYVTATNGCGVAAVSDVVSVRVNVGPDIVTNPQNTTVCKDQTTTLSVTATGTAPLQYQWYEVHGAADALTLIPGATESTYTVPTNVAGERRYRVIVSNVVGSVYSYIATVTTMEPVQITSHPTLETININATVGENVGLSFTTVGATFHRWYTVNGATLTPIAGATTNSYTFPTGTVGTFTYQYGAGNLCGEVPRKIIVTVSAAYVGCTATPTQVVELLSSTGRIWMDRNLGATKSASSSTDSDAYGDIFQWGRPADGQQCESETYLGPVNNTNNNTANGWYGKFIKMSGNTTNNFNWYDGNDETLWQGVNGKNNPCPTGYRLPTEAEWNAEGITNATTAMTKLKLPLPGLRHYLDGFTDGPFEYQNVGTVGHYWLSTVSTTPETDIGGSRYVKINDTSVIENSTRAMGYSVRCIKN